MKSPVLFLIFNRPDTTKIVFSEIRKAKPPRLYVAADGARASREGESEICDQTRSILDLVDWQCEVYPLFRDKNLGCRKAVSSAVDWFFEHEEAGIILEDDIVPAPEFFSFCDEALDRYRDEPKVMMIAGYNPLGANVESSDSFFSENSTIWGWATWRTRWKSYDVSMSDWSEKTFLDVVRGRLTWYVKEYFIDAYHKTQSGAMNTWDYQWAWAVQKSNALILKPVANLITNIGVQGTHASGIDKNHYVAYGKVGLGGVRLPERFSVDCERDQEWGRFAFEGQKLRLFVRHVLRKMGLLDAFRARLRK